MVSNGNESRVVFSHEGEPLQYLMSHLRRAEANRPKVENADLPLSGAVETPEPQSETPATSEREEEV